MTLDIIAIIALCFLGLALLILVLALLPVIWSIKRILGVIELILSDTHRDILPHLAKLASIGRITDVMKGWGLHSKNILLSTLKQWRQKL